MQEKAPDSPTIDPALNLAVLSAARGLGLDLCLTSSVKFTLEMLQKHARPAAAAAAASRDVDGGVGEILVRRVDGTQTRWEGSLLVQSVCALTPSRSADSALQAWAKHGHLLHCRQVLEAPRAAAGGVEGWVVPHRRPRRAQRPRAARGGIEASTDTEMSPIDPDPKHWH